MTYVRRINLKNSVNLRDLGGYMREDGKITKFGQFLRSGNLSNLTDEEAKFLINYGLKTVIDLRTEKEISKQPSKFTSAEEVKYIHFPFFEETTPHLSAEFDLGGLYEFMLNKSSLFGGLFTTIAENCNGAVLFNCTAGKDRTGITAALLLLLAGIDEEDVIADYQVSSIYFRKSFEDALKLHPDMPVHFSHSNPEWIEGFINSLKKSYGNAENFLIEKGVSQNNIDIIKNKLI